MQRSELILIFIVTVIVIVVAFVFVFVFELRDLLKRLKFMSIDLQKLRTGQCLILDAQELIHAMLAVIAIATVIIMSLSLSLKHNINWYCYKNSIFECTGASPCDVGCGPKQATDNTSNTFTPGLFHHVLTPSWLKRLMFLGFQMLSKKRKESKCWIKTAHNNPMLQWMTSRFGYPKYYLRKKNVELRLLIIIQMLQYV